MALFDEDDKPKKPSSHQIGQDLSQLSVEDIEARIEQLNAEIERLAAARAAKTASRAAAESFFKT
jgi:uncharacterized small protein (DUF1192 family)